MKNLENGFSLIEVLVALTIMGISLGLLLQVFSGGLRQMVSEEERFKAILVSQSLINDLGHNLPLAVGQQRGQSLHGYDWVIDIQPYESRVEAVNIVRPQGGLYDIIIRVTWRSGLRQRGITLHSLRFNREADL